MQSNNGSVCLDFTIINPPQGGTLNIKKTLEGYRVSAFKFGVQDYKKRYSPIDGVPGYLPFGLTSALEGDVFKTRPGVRPAYGDNFHYPATRAFVVKNVDLVEDPQLTISGNIELVDDTPQGRYLIDNFNSGIELYFMFEKQTDSLSFFITFPGLTSRILAEFFVLTRVKGLADLVR